MANRSERFNLTQGSILHKLVALALPIMGTNLVTMAYNLVDMFWLGRLGSAAVAASGTVGTYMWLAMALQNYGNRGAEIGVSQNLGRGDAASARGYASSSFWLGLGLGVLFGAFMFLFSGPLIGFFGIQKADVVRDAELYLRIVALGVPFNYIGAVATGCFSGSGNSLTPFYITSFGLVLNMALDPLLIFNAGLGIGGAAIATVTAQVVTGVAMVAALLKYRHPAFTGFTLWVRPVRRQLASIFSWATPIVLESFFFTFLVMLISRFVAGFGADAIAIQRIGTQVESLSWLIAGGFASAFTAYVGQNFGARAFGRIHKGFGIATAAMAAWGGITTLVLLLGAEAIFGVFLPGEPALVREGAVFLRIMALCQLPQCLEPIAAGAFRGMGRSTPPSLVSIGANTLRMLMAWGLCRTSLGVDGIWWALSLGAALRGVAAYVAWLLAARRMPR